MGEFKFQPPDLEALESTTMYRLYLAYIDYWWPTRLYHRCDDSHQCFRNKPRRRRLQKTSTGRPCPMHRACKTCGKTHSCSGRWWKRPAPPPHSLRYRYARRLWALEQRLHVAAAKRCTCVKAPARPNPPGLQVAFVDPGRSGLSVHDRA